MKIFYHTHDGSLPGIAFIIDFKLHSFANRIFPSQFGRERFIDQCCSILIGGHFG